MLPWKLPGADKYGAQMGRNNSFTAVPHDYSGSIKLHLRRVHINSGGYDAGGAYWGLGAPLWCVWVEKEDGETLASYHRSPSRELVRQLYPNARFFQEV